MLLSILPAWCLCVSWGLSVVAVESSCTCRAEEQMRSGSACEAVRLWRASCSACGGKRSIQGAK